MLWCPEPVLVVRWAFPFDLWLSQPCWGQDLLSSCWSRSPKSWVNQAPLSLSACPAPKEVTTETNEAHADTVDLCAIHASIHSPTQKQHKVASHSPLCSSQIYCKSQAGDEAQWLQESRWLCCCLGPVLPLWQTSPRTCLPQSQHQALMWSGWIWGAPTGK